MRAEPTGTRQRTPLSALAATLLATAGVLAACTTSEPGPASAPPDGNTGSGAGPPTSGQKAPVDAPADTAQVDTVQVVVVGDELTQAPAGTPAWPTLLAADLGAAALPVDVAVSAPSGAGFTGSPSFSDLVPTIATGSTQLVLFFDGRLAETAAAEDEVTRTAVAVERASPDALLVVVGPVGGTGVTDPAAVPDVRTAAEEANATYVDPVAEDWPSDPTAAEVAARLGPHLRPLVEALAMSGANR
jgi:hypothetical protein